MRWLDGIINVIHMNLGKIPQTVRDREWSQRVGHTWVTEEQ